jgi:hypothetical protein
VQQLVDVVSTGGIRSTGGSLDACDCCTLQVGLVEVARGAFCATLGQNLCSPVEQRCQHDELSGLHEVLDVSICTQSSCMWACGSSYHLKRYDLSQLLSWISNGMLVLTEECCQAVRVFAATWLGLGSYTVYGQTDPVRCLVCFLVGSSTALGSKVQCIVCGSAFQSSPRGSLAAWRALWQPGGKKYRTCKAYMWVQSPCEMVCRYAC